MTKRMIFMVFMAVSCLLLFLQRLTGMGIHAVLGIAVPVVSILHTVKFRKVWKTRTRAQKIWEIVMWAGLAVAFLSGLLMKPFGGFAMVMIHKLSSVVFVAGLIAHVMEHIHLFRRKK